MADTGKITQIWRHAGGEGSYCYLDDMTTKELAEQEAEHRSYDAIAAADAANDQKRFERYTQQQQDERAQKFDLHLRIGVFFDGTGNNASNAADGQRCGAHHPVNLEDLDESCKPYMSEPDSSYGNDPSNISKLHDLYEFSKGLTGSGQHKSIRRRLYIEGIGTQTGKADNTFGLGTGRGETGVEARVEDAFKKIFRLMNNLHQEHPNAEIRSLTLDTFGFSRGAAAARHFANQVANRNNGPLIEVLRTTKARLSPHFLADSCDVSVRFIGLFDTVASIAALSNLGNYSSSHVPRLQLYLNPQLFPCVVQLAARDEKRFNFALSHVGPDHFEVTLPGAHSDLGGGYRALTEEILMVTPMQSLEVAREQDVSETSIYRDAEQARARWINDGWPADTLHIVTPQALPLPADTQDRMGPARKKVYAGVQSRREVRGELSRVYLRVMHALAKAKNVPFGDIDPLEPEYAIPGELQSLSDKLVTGNYSITPAEDALLKQRYIHISGNWNHPHGRETGDGLTLRYINSPMEDGIRVRHPHIPS